MAITDWPIDERPRERLLNEGPRHLSDAELLAIFLRIGSHGKSAVDLAREVMKHFGSLNGLFSARLSDFKSVNGIGPAKYAQLQAILELSRRLLFEDLETGVVLSSPKSVKDYLHLSLCGRSQETFVALFLDVKNRLIESVELFQGTLSHTSVYPRELIKAALSRNAASVILAHNHPTGTVEPSEADKELTSILKEALDMVEVRLLDHFVVAAGADVYSFAEHGLL
ncbi:MAG: DNA repair protein RadC [Betaproteobacteria bacterium]|nr:DNA repair protein RadC [Betaproteobacteria bacterium]